MIIKLHESDWRECREIRLRALQNEPALFGRSYEDESTTGKPFSQLFE
jgi:hypothetical protein